jgi:putative ATPase
MDLFPSSCEPPSDPEPEAGPGTLPPLADRMRPRSLEEMVGQEHLLGPEGLLVRLVNEQRLISMILWGPPGSGKTTLARLLAHQVGARLRALSAVTSGVKDIKAVMEWAQAQRQFEPDQPAPVLFIDEIHRHNKAQQDQLLPHVERGTVTLIGATTENPSFEIISPLLSRCRALTLNPLNLEELILIMRRALADRERGVGAGMGIPAPLEGGAEDEALAALAELADGDARRALNALELAASLSADQGITMSTVQDVAQRAHLIYDRAGEEHYNQISALHKALRGSDVQAAIYWTLRMLEAGEDPLYVARRLIRFASEDVGLADPQALSMTLAARQAYETLGSPEGDLAIVQAAAYLATAPKSNALYRAEKAAREVIRQTGSLPVPLHIRNAPTGLMKEMGYGEGYQYDHDHEGGHAAGQEYLPEALRGRIFYDPTRMGFEKTIRERLAWWAKRRSNVEGRGSNVEGRSSKEDDRPSDAE